MFTQFIFLFAAATGLLWPSLTGFIVSVLVNYEIRFPQTRIQTVKTYSTKIVASPKLDHRVYPELTFGVLLEMNSFTAVLRFWPSISLAYFWSELRLADSI